MVRIVGVNIPDREHVVIGLQHIFGIGHSRAKEICDRVGLAYSVKIKELTDKDLNNIRAELNKFNIEGNLKRSVALSIKRLIDIKCYRGRRHVLGLPVRGQRTRTNANTRKSRKRN